MERCRSGGWLGAGDVHTPRVQHWPSERFKVASRHSHRRVAYRGAKGKPRPWRLREGAGGTAGWLTEAPFRLHVRCLPHLFVRSHMHQMFLQADYCIPDFE